VFKGRVMIEIRRDDLTGEPTRALLALHLAGMHERSPPGSVFALDLSGLQAPEVAVWSAWIDGEIAGVAALKRLGPDAAEIKSMRTHPAHLRRGVANTLLRHLLEESRSGGVRRLSLETGSGPAFGAALALYRACGFESGPAFGDYSQSEFNQFLHLSL
jgi:putative acetyltransferase